MSRTLKVTGNHVMYDRSAWFLRVIMSSSRALCCLPSVKKQKHDFQVCFVDLARHRKSSWRQGLTSTKRSTKVAKELFADYVKEKKLREPEEKKELAQTLKTCYVEARKKGFVQCIIKQLLDSVFNNNLITPTSTLIILDITKTSSNTCIKFVRNIKRRGVVILCFLFMNNLLLIPTGWKQNRSLYRGCRYIELRYIGVALYSEQILTIPWPSVTSRLLCRKNHDGRFPYSLMAEALFEWILRTRTGATSVRLI